MKKSELDQFYTKPEIAKKCIEMLPIFKDGIDLYLEPSAGNGSFLHALPKPNLGLDIDPQAVNIIKQDFLAYYPETTGNILVIGNPPFGKNASLAVKFFNHAAKWAYAIAFIVPKTFRKHTIQNSLSLNFVLSQEFELPLNSFLLHENGKLTNYNVPCVWQVWIRGSRQKVVLPTCHSDWSWVTKKDATHAVRRVGALAGKVLDDFEGYAESSNYFIKTSPEIANIIRSLYADFQKTAHNTVGNPSLSKAEFVDIYTRNKNV